MTRFREREGLEREQIISLKLEQNSCEGEAGQSTYPIGSYPLEAAAAAASLLIDRK